MWRVVGPNLVSATRDVTVQPCTGAYLALISLALLAMVLMSRIEFPPLPQAGDGSPQGRPLREIARQPLFIGATAACALGYGVMSLLMSATPIAMAQYCPWPAKWQMRGL
jgi:hypothetical protein